MVAEDLAEVCLEGDGTLAIISAASCKSRALGWMYRADVRMSIWPRYCATLL